MSGVRAWQRRAWLAIPICVALGVALGHPNCRISRAAPAPAAEAGPAAEAERPIALFCIASIDRLVGDVNYVFEAAGRPEFADYVGSLLTNVRDFKGLDRKKPLGVMAFIDPAVDLKPVPVAFFPVENVTELTQTISDSSKKLLMLRKGDGDDVYELVTPPQTFPVRLQGGYAFVAQDPQTLARDIIDPAVLTESLATRYDVAGSISLERVPQALRVVFAQSLRGAAQAELQQRDGESDTGYRLRRANGESLLEILQMAIQEGQTLTLGWNLSAEDRHAAFDADLQVTQKSPFAEYLQDVAGRPSQFDNLLNDESPFTFSTSWSMAKPGKKAMQELVNVFETELSKQFDSSQGAPTPANRLAGVFRETSEAGHLDFFVQMRPEEAKTFVLLGAAKVADGKKAEQAIAEILQKVGKNADVAELQLNASTHGDVTLHRIRGKRVSRQDERLYGSNPSFYVGGGGKTLWFALGGPRAIPALHSAIDQAQAPRRVTDQQSNIPFRVAVNMVSWAAMSNSQSPPSVAAKSAFAPDNDALRIDLRPTENGARLHVEFEQGFIRFVGMAIAQRLEKRLQF